MTGTVDIVRTDMLGGGLTIIEPAISIDAGAITVVDFPPAGQWAYFIRYRAAPVYEDEVVTGATLVLMNIKK